MRAPQSQLLGLLCHTSFLFYQKKSVTIFLHKGITLKFFTHCLRPSLLSDQRGWSFFCENLQKCIKKANGQKGKKAKFETMAAYKMVIWLKMKKKK